MAVARSRHQSGRAQEAQAGGPACPRVSRHGPYLGLPRPYLDFSAGGGIWGGICKCGSYFAFLGQEVELPDADGVLPWVLLRDDEDEEAKNLIFKDFFDPVGTTLSRSKKLHFLKDAEQQVTIFE